MSEANDIFALVPNSQADGDIRWLKAECERLRQLAHEAPRSSPGSFNSAWSDRSREYAEAKASLAAIRKETER